MERLIGILTAQGSLQGFLSGASAIDGTLTVPERVETLPFTGEYTYTPSNAEQTIEINGLRATDNITINAIPSNYGLITWDGATLTVS